MLLYMVSSVLTTDSFSHIIAYMLSPLHLYHSSVGKGFQSERGCFVLFFFLTLNYVQPLKFKLSLLKIF